MTRESSLPFEVAEDRALKRARVPQVEMPIDDVLDGRWQADAACVEHRLPEGVTAETFHPVSDVGPSRLQIRAAQDVCAGCSFNLPCREMRYAYGASGVWGGVYYAGSAAGVKGARQKCAVTRCTNRCRHGSRYCSVECEHSVKAGTLAGYELHLRNRAVLPTCGPCRDAKRVRTTQTVRDQSQAARAGAA